MQSTSDKLSYRLLDCITELMLCSRCLRAGTLNPVPQLISIHHRPSSLCRDCREAANEALHERSTGQVIPILSAWQKRCKKASH